jgi:phage terminase large subunit-like protein
VKGRKGPCGCGCALTVKTSFGFDVADFAQDILGRPLDAWQRYLVIHACELLPDGRPRFRQVLALVARQNGKTEVLVILTLYWMFIERVGMVLGTSSKLDYARESWKKAVSLARGIPALEQLIPKSGGIRRTNGEEEFSTSDGSRYRIAAANEEGGRSLTVDRLVLDELRQHHDWDAYSASTKATNAVKDAQVWMISNAGSDRSVVLNELREQAIKGVDYRLGIFEWSSPDGMEADDPEALAMANPSLGHRMDIDALLGEAKRAKAAGGEQLASFLTEVHCRRVSLDNPAIDPVAWDACLDPHTSLDGLRDRVAVCLDVSLDESHATLYAAAVDGDLVRVDLVAEWFGMNAVREMTAALPGLLERVKPQALGWFPNGPAASATASLAERPGWPPVGVALSPIRGDIAAACMGFAEQVRSRAIAHSGDPLLDAHVRAAEKVSHGDGWRFTRRGAGQVDAVYAAAGAVHLARTLPERTGPGVFWFEG